jgi:hypothetical protein
MNASTNTTTFNAHAVGIQCAKSFSALNAASALLWAHLNDCGFNQWEATRQEFQAGAHSAGYLDVESLWGAVTRMGRAQGLLKAKPKAPSEQAQNKDEGRKAIANAAKTALEKGETPAQVFALAEKAEGKERAKLRDQAIKMASLTDSREADAVKDALKSAREKFELALKSAKEKKAVTAETYKRLLAALDEPKPKRVPTPKAKVATA